MIEALLEADVVAFDFETQSDMSGRYGNLEYWHPHSRITSASYTVRGEGTWVIPCSHPEGPWTEKWKTLLTNVHKAILSKTKTKLIGHNLKYDMTWAWWMTGVALEPVGWWDTMMSDYVLDENEAHSLKEKAVRDLGVDRWDDVDLRDSESQPWDSLALYNARDTDYTDRLQVVDQAALEQEPRLARLFHFLGMPIIRTLTRIERNGLPIDQSVVAVRKAQAEAVVEEEHKYLMRIATEEYGMDPEDYPTVSFSSTNKWFKEFMERSPMPVVSLTDTGNPSWTADNLEHLEREGHELARHVLDIRKNGNRLSKFLVPWMEKLADDGRLHPTFNPMRVDDKWSDVKGTTTGRLSSSNPNAQQIARELKPCFGGEEGWLFVELDYSQIELRVAAWIANDRNMLAAYERGDDLHTLMAADINDKEPKEVTKTERQGGKAGNFGFLYDMGENTYVDYAYTTYGVTVTYEEARKVRKAFFNRWADLQKWHRRQRNLVRKYGFVRNPIGRKRRLPEIRTGTSYEIGRAERRAINSPVQSMASDLMCLALIEIDRQMDPEQVRLVGTVHDSLLAQFRPDTLDENLERVAHIMLDPGTSTKFGVNVEVPLEVEASIGYHWNDPEGETRVYR